MSKPELEEPNMKKQYNNRGELIVMIFYWEDGITVKSIIDFDPKINKPFKETIYRDGKKWNVTQYNPTTGKKIKSTFYEDDGITIESTTNYNLTTGEEI